MSRKITLAAAALALAAAALALAGTGLTLAGAPAQAATSTPVPSVRVTAPCVAGAGSIKIAVHRTDKGTAAATRISGVTHAHWSGGTFIGEKAIEKGLSGEPAAYDAVDGVVKTWVTSALSWPRPALGTYVSKRGRTICSAGAQLLPRMAVGAAINGAMGETLLMVHRNTQVVTVEEEMIPKGRWKVNVRLWTPAGFQHRAKPITVKKAPGSYGVRFTGFKKVHGFTKAVVVVTSAKGKRLSTLTLARSS